ncbi:hypothetical protein DRA42_00105 [Ethanoligenens harbinense]|nr:hypothetical protein CXQ68_00095 [Ethanoligenens harbinense YUAN-3]AYF37478.1 hypothetical protein CXP51_00095 [Ethanoligenens harbinense]AYF40198.1 hypothetical protein CN246_00090 [Ethanoligenens harbinense]QCN91033.1 hypothetical protein DRA42_00105 [Ethanoligenens harbinense]
MLPASIRAGIIFAQMNDSFSLINDFYFAVLIPVCTAAVISEIRKLKKQQMVFYRFHAAG